jgi:hypothetical protein
VPDDVRRPVDTLLQQLPTPKSDALKQLFCSELNDERANQRLSPTLPPLISLHGVATRRPGVAWRVTHGK